MIDVFMATVLFFGSLISLAGVPDLEGARPSDPWSYTLIAAQTLPLAWRRRHPTAVLGIVTFAFMAERGLNYPQSWASFGIVFALYSVGAEIRFKRSRIIAGSVIALSAA